MQVLIIKTSSLGDIIHTLPALTDAGKAIPNIKFDWVIEEDFAEIPKWHPLVNTVIPIAIRRWRKNPIKSLFTTEWRAALSQIKAKKYDLIIDPQGLLKSAIICRMAKGFRVGLDKKSLTESLARFAYQKTVSVDLQKHALFRMRSIFAQALNYELPLDPPDYGFNKQNFAMATSEKYILFLHGTTWQSKHWPDKYWLELANIIEQNGYKILLPWNSQIELKRVNNIAKQCQFTEVLTKMNLTKIAALIANATAVVSVDTGLAHLAAALNTPAITLYGPTNPKRIGTIGENQTHLQSANCKYICCNKPYCKYANHEIIQPCFEKITPLIVWENLQKILDSVAETN